MVRFRRPVEEVDAVQFTGSWGKLCLELGWTSDELNERWPKVDRDFDGTMYSPPRYGRPLVPMRIDVGDWVILRDGMIVSTASESWFDEWERLDD